MPIIKAYAPGFFPSEDTQISKYLDLSKFLSILSTKSLFFCRIDKLEDQFEGKTARRNYEFRVQQHKEAALLAQKDLSDIEILKQVDEMYELEKLAREVNCVCCWNKTEEESAALWKIYSDFGKGIMIKTTVRKLIEAFADTPEPIFISEIKYLNRDRDLMLDFNTAYPIFHKQLSYNYEDEIRLLYEVISPQIGRSYNWAAEQIEEGKLLKVDLLCLIDEIIIGPFAPKWMSNLIFDLVQKFELKKIVKKSNL